MAPQSKSAEWYPRTQSREAPPGRLDVGKEEAPPGRLDVAVPAQREAAGG